MGQGATTRRWRRTTLWLWFVAALMLSPSARAQDDRIDDLPAVQFPGGGGGASTPARPPMTGVFAEPALLTSAMTLATDWWGENGRPKDGFYPELSNMITGSGFVSLGPGYRRYFSNRRGFVDTSAAASWHLYKMAQGRVEWTDLAGQHLSVGSQGMWQDQTQVDYFGIGSGSLQDQESQYRLQTFDVVGYATYRPTSTLAIAGEFGWLERPTVSTATGTFNPNLPSISEVFPNDPGVPLSSQPNFLHNEASVTYDSRDYVSHPTSGALYRAAMTVYTDQDAGTFSFRQYEAEVGEFVPVNDERTWVLAFHGWVVASDVPPGHDVPFYLLPTLGGHNTLRSYSDFRFHDRAAAVVNAESRWAMFTHVDGAVFVDAGNVGHRAADLNLDKTSVGAGVRLHSAQATWARVDVAHGAEGWQVVFRTSDPLRLSRLSRRVAAVPFVP